MTAAELYGAGYTAEIAVVSVAVQDAAADAEAAEGVHVPVPKLAVPLVNVTKPVGPAPLLCVEITAVRVTLVPEVMLVRLLATFVVVAAFVIVTLSAFEVTGPV